MRQDVIGGLQSIEGVDIAWTDPSVEWCGIDYVYVVEMLGVWRGGGEEGGVVVNIKGSDDLEEAPKLAAFKYRR